MKRLNDKEIVKLKDTILDLENNKKIIKKTETLEKMDFMILLIKQAIEDELLQRKKIKDIYIKKD